MNSRLKLLITANWLLILAVVFPFLIALRSILTGSTPFWYDPARDLLSAAQNLEKPTLIGPPTGIPGIFYGPYWIWFLSLGLLISPNPRVVNLLVSTLPYFVVFPLLLLHLRKVFGTGSTIVLWLLFIYSSITYATFMWNPHPAPLLYLAAVVVLLSKNRFRIPLLGFLLGLTTNFHVSFGVTASLAGGLYVLVESLLERKTIKTKFIKMVTNGLGLGLGCLVSWLPFFVFELRHDFLQTKTLLTTVNQSFIQGVNPVSLQGLSNTEIGHAVVEKLAVVLGLPLWLAIGLFSFGLIVYVTMLRRDFRLGQAERRLWAWLLIHFSSLFAVYVSSSNPVWSYHFIGVEVMVLLLLGLFYRRVLLVKVVLGVLVVFLTLGKVSPFISSFTQDPTATQSIANRETITRTIFTHDQATSIAIAAYSPSIYTFDFDYMIQWLKQNYPHKQVTEITEAQTVYLIIPPTTEAIYADFINYKTPSDLFTTVDSFAFADGTTVVVRQPVSN